MNVRDCKRPLHLRAIGVLAGSYSVQPVVRGSSGRIQVILYDVLCSLFQLNAIAGKPDAINVF